MTLLVIVVMCSTSGCAVLHKRTRDPVDPFEAYNRNMFEFNMAIDKVIYRPVAVTYTEVIPGPLRINVRNFFDNIGEIPTVVNDVLQGDIRYAFADSWRFLINSTIGVLGIFDVAKHIGLPSHENDFGLTLAKWGVHDSPYFVVPFLGPSTIRDSIAFPINYFFTVWPYIRPYYVSIGVHAFDLVRLRAQLLPADRLLKQSFDPYVFVRNAYLQRRREQIQKSVADQPGQSEDTFVEPLESEKQAERLAQAKTAKQTAAKQSSGSAQQTHATSPSNAQSKQKQREHAAAARAANASRGGNYARDSWINHQ